MKAKRKAKDVVSNLPSDVIEIILCHLPIRDAVRTSILSKNWRYKWATIPKLVFDVDDMFDILNEEHQQLLEQPDNERKKSTGICKAFYAIQQVLLLHRGPILEFTIISMFEDNKCVEIDQIMRHLSRKNTLKKLTLIWFDSYKLPLSIFSLHQLTDLSLHACNFDFSPTFSGFGGLTSLSLHNVDIRKETLLHLLSNCPLLKHLCLDFDCPDFDKGLFINVNELAKCLPMIEDLDFFSYNVECFDTRELSTTLVHLKSLCISEILFTYKEQLHPLFLLMKSSPNLEKIKLEQERVGDPALLGWPEKTSIDDYFDIWLEHLDEVEIQNFTTMGLELEFVKLILVRSPVLKLLRIGLATWVENDDELMILRILLYLPRASPSAKIIVNCRA